MPSHSLCRRWSGYAGETQQSEASPADLAAFIEVLMPLIASRDCGDLTEAAHEFQTHMTENVSFQKRAQKFQRFAHEAPLEIQDDLQTFADPYSKFASALDAVEALDGVDLAKPTPETLEKLQEGSAAGAVLETGVDRREMQQATHHVFAWMRIHCT